MYYIYGTLQNKSVPYLMTLTTFSTLFFVQNTKCTIFVVYLHFIEYIIYGISNFRTD